MIMLTDKQKEYHSSVLSFFLKGTLLIPTLTLLSPYTVFSSGEAVRFSCSVVLGHHISDFHLHKHGVSTPLVTQRVDQTQIKAELTLTDVETFHEGSYSCQYRIKGGFPSQLLSSPPSNSINITVGEDPPPEPVPVLEYLDHVYMYKTQLNSSLSILIQWSS